MPSLSKTQPNIHISSKLKAQKSSSVLLYKEEPRSPAGFRDEQVKESIAFVRVVHFWILRLGLDGFVNEVWAVSVRWRQPGHAWSGTTV